MGETTIPFGTQNRLQLAFLKSRLVLVLFSSLYIGTIHAHDIAQYDVVAFSVSMYTTNTQENITKL